MKEGLGIWAWLGIRRFPDLTKARPLGAFFGMLLVLTGLALLLMAIIAFAQLFMAVIGLGPFGGDATGAAIRNIGLVLVAVFGAPFLVWRSIVAQKQVDIAEQGQITDRINKAVEGLGAEKVQKIVDEKPRFRKKGGQWMTDADGVVVTAIRPDGKPLVERSVYEISVPNLEVRIGSIYALERIAKDSLRDHLQIMEILCAYVRENSRVEGLTPADEIIERPDVRSDLQVAITVLGRRSDRQMAKERSSKFRLDLQGSDLSGVDFSGGDFSAAKFHRCRLEASIFVDCHLSATQFFGSLLNYSDFARANLEGTRFDGATINKPIPSNGGMNLILALANIYGATFIGSDISAIDYLGGVEETNLTFGSKDTKLHPSLEFDRSIWWRNWKDVRSKRKEGNSFEASLLEEEVYSTQAFADWVPFDAYDGAMGSMHKAFLKRLKLEGWPFEK
ncbi:pentapeptide repeat-containing protein [Roseibium polysiphoniae]|uniref:pentapeptide repeat-containing protein n=1 Tax=Roseibium polysiphoniae TaxID=2571221 RepID=UPI0032997612